jgi:RsiW-degrading membrane proteinase PrsW (M82 family)
VNLAVAAAGALPALLAMAYFDHLDRKRPEPRGTLRGVALVGALSVIPCVLVELALAKLAPVWLMRGYAGALFTGFVVAAAIEELAKTLCLRLVVWRRPELDERMDGIVYAARAGLGFALVENIVYLFGTRTILSFIGMYALRAVLTVPMHAVSAATMGYYAAKRRFDGVGPGFVGGYALAVLLHGTFDAALFGALHAMVGKAWLVTSLLLPIPLLVTAAGVVAARRMAAQALAGDDAERRELDGGGPTPPRLAPARRPGEPRPR